MKKNKKSNIDGVTGILGLVHNSSKLLRLINKEIEEKQLKSIFHMRYHSKADFDIFTSITIIVPGNYGILVKSLDFIPTVEHLHRSTT